MVQNTHLLCLLTFASIQPRMSLSKLGNFCTDYQRLANRDRLVPRLVAAHRSTPKGRLPRAEDRRLEGPVQGQRNLPRGAPAGGCGRSFSELQVSADFYGTFYERLDTTLEEFFEFIVCLQY